MRDFVWLRRVNLWSLVNKKIINLNLPVSNVIISQCRRISLTGLIISAQSIAFRASFTISLSALRLGREIAWSTQWGTTTDAALHWQTPHHSPFDRLPAESTHGLAVACYCWYRELVHIKLFEKRKYSVIYIIVTPVPLPDLIISSGTKWQMKENLTTSCKTM